MRRWIILIFFMSLWGYGLVQARAASPFKGQVFMYYREGKEVMQEQITHAADQEESPPEITAWSLARDVEVTNREMGKTEKADCMAVYGMKEMASHGRLLKGTYGYRTDKEGCVISRGLAMELFGSLDVAGKYVWCRGSSYIVRGVTDRSEYIILVPAGKDEGMRFMLMDCGEESSGKVDAERFLYKYGISRGETLVDGSLFFAAAGIAVILCLWAVPAWLCYMVWRHKMRAERSLWVYGLAAAIFLAGLYLIRVIELKIPADLIPSRWSDFDFWAKKAEELCRDIEGMGEAGQVQWLVQLRKRLWICILCTIGGSLGSMVMFHKIIRDSFVQKDL